MLGSQMRAVLPRLHHTTRHSRTIPGLLRFYSPWTSETPSSSSTGTSSPSSAASGSGTGTGTGTPTTTEKRRTATSLFNTAKSFQGDDTPLPLNITNKKYSDQGSLLIMDLSPRAIERLNAISKEEANPNLALRIGVESGGCHGFQYNLNLSDLNTVAEEDCVFEKGGAHVIVDDASLAVLKESKVDYTTELIGSMFKVVESPYMVSSCGCGSSFDVDFEKLG